LTAALLLAVALSGMAPVGGRKAKASEVAAQPAAGPSAGAATQAGAKPTPGVTTESEAGGTHIRIETSSGPVHVFRPAGFDRKTAGVVVYVHGYYTHIDDAWREHKLADQFAASRRN